MRLVEWTARLTYVRCGFRIQPYAHVWPEGVEKEGAGGSSPTLPTCGQLTRCFSAVAELLVIALPVVSRCLLELEDSHPSTQPFLLLGAGQSNLELS